MKIPNYDLVSESDSDHKRLLPYMPSNTFRMLMRIPSGCGKTNTLMHMLYKLLYYDKIYLFSKNLELPKYRKLLETFRPISEEVRYQVIEESNNEIIPLDELDNDNQTIVTLLHEIFATRLFRDFEVRIFRDTLISRFCENFAF